MQWNDKVQWVLDSLSFLHPELVLSTAILLLFFSSFIKRPSYHVFRWISSLALIVALTLVLAEWPQRSLVLMVNMLQWDQFASSIKIIILTGGLLSVWMGRSSSRPVYTAEYFMLILSVCLGGALLAMSMNLLMMILSLELISISSYVLASFRLDRHAAESSLKYFLFGAVITGVALFGMSLLFGLTGTLVFSSQSFSEGLLNHPGPLTVTAGIMVLAALLFKMAIVPFHWWAPDIYEASPTPVSALFSVVPKVAGMAAMVRLSLALHLFGQSYASWQWILSSLAIVTIIAGNLAALGQQHVRRLMAYSSISQAGFLLAAVSIFTPQGIEQCIFYAVSLLFGNYLVFGMLDYYEERYGMQLIRDYSGQGHQNVLAGILLTFGLISLVGLPPAGGFMAKFLVFATVFDEYQSGGKEILLILLLTGLLGTALSLFYYMKIPYALYFQATRQEGSGKRRPMTYGMLGIILAFLLLLMFAYPSLLTQWLNRLNFAF